MVTVEQLQAHCATLAARNLLTILEARDRSDTCHGRESPAPSEADFEAAGRAVAHEIGRHDDVLRAAYNPATRTVDIIVKPAALGFPVEITIK
jgi:hypothetical protein